MGPQKGSFGDLENVVCLRLVARTRTRQAKCTLSHALAVDPIWACWVWGFRLGSGIDLTSCWIPYKRVGLGSQVTFESRTAISSYEQK